MSAHRGSPSEALERENARLRAELAARDVYHMSTAVERKKLDAQLRKSSTELDSLRLRLAHAENKLARREFILGKLLPPVAVVFAIALALGLTIECAREVGTELPRNVRGIVTDKYHYDAYTSESCVTINKVLTCTPQYHPERWEVRVAHDGHDRVDGVTEAEFVNIDEGDWR